MRLLRPELLQWWQVLPVLVACWAIHCDLYPAGLAVAGAAGAALWLLL